MDNANPDLLLSTAPHCRKPSLIEAASRGNAVSFRLVAYLFVGLVASVGLSGCVFNLAADDQAVETFSEAFGICRMQQPGRANRRLHLPPTHCGVAHCLRWRGWNSDGSRIQHAPPLSRCRQDPAPTDAASGRCASDIHESSVRGCARGAVRINEWKISSIEQSRALTSRA
jgi:hypothetical protein